MFGGSRLPAVLGGDFLEKCFGVAPGKWSWHDTNSAKDEKRHGDATKQETATKQTSTSGKLRNIRGMTIS